MTDPNSFLKRCNDFTSTGSGWCTPRRAPRSVMAATMDSSTSLASRASTKPRKSAAYGANTSTRFGAGPVVSWRLQEDAG